MVEDPEEIVVVLGAEHLGDVPSTGPQDLAGKPQAREHQLRLHEGVLQESSRRQHEDQSSINSEGGQKAGAEGLGRRRSP